MINQAEVVIRIRQRILLLKQKKGLTTTELSSLSGIHKSTIAHIEDPNYDFTPSLTTLILLANALDMSLTDLFKGF